MSDSPTFLYVFTFPNGDIERLTGDNETVGLAPYGPDGVTLGGNLYRYASVSHGSVKQTNQIKKQELTIGLPLTDETGRRLVSTPEPEAIGLTIFKAELLAALDPFNPELLVVWSGTVGGASVKKEQIDVVGVNVFASMQLSGNRARYSRLCRHALYGSGCGIGTGPYQSSGVLTGSSGVTAEVSLPTLPEIESLIGGLVIYDTTRYFIVSGRKSSSDPLDTNYELNVDRPFLEVSGVTSVAVAPGCDRTQETCENRFGNIANFGGFPYIPSKNPFTLSAIV